MDNLKTRIGKKIAAYLEAPKPNYVPFAITSKDMLCRTLQPGDILLVEGNTRVSTAIKYLIAVDMVTFRLLRGRTPPRRRAD
ncbi:hypothetical protein [Sulfitobacter sp.]|uniref:hypothetical protein n=1 Tax=Sulfitobacter sp. TaxID=1903071 RepID=UPI003002F716